MSDYDPAMPILRQMLALSLINKLDDCGFELLANPREAFGLARPELAERVYGRDVSPDGRVRVKVFTSVIGGENGVPFEVRKEGKDAIRVCATYMTRDGKERGLVKETRINRTGNIDGIVDRMYQRMRSSYQSANTCQRCHSCGAPKFVSKNDKLCCAEICWKTEEEKTADNAAWKTRGRRKYRRRYYR